MADITAPTFVLTAVLTPSVPDNVIVTDATDYSGAGEVASDFYTKLFVWRLAAITEDVTNTPDSGSDNLITDWNYDISSDGEHKATMAVGLLYGAEAVSGTFAKGAITYYSSAFYIATANIVGSTNPSLTTGVDANFILLTDLEPYLGYVLYTASIHTLADETVKEKIHEDTRTFLKNFDANCDCSLDCEDLAAKQNYWQAAQTEHTLANYQKAHNYIQKLLDLYSL